MICHYWRRLLGAVFLITLAAPVAGWAQASPNQKLVEAAKKEGELVYYTTMTLDQSKIVTDRFEKKYGIKATLFRTGGGPLLNKFSPRRAADDTIGTSSSGAARWPCH
ncbi:MAG: hypothetical protein ABW099_06480 [Candidatus Binatia bacterium]